MRVETRAERFSGDFGFLLLLEVLDDTGFIDHLVGRLHSPRCPERVVQRMLKLMLMYIAMIAVARQAACPVDSGF